MTGPRFREPSRWRGTHMQGSHGRRGPAYACLAVLPEMDKHGWCRDYEMGPIEEILTARFIRSVLYKYPIQPPLPSPRHNPEQRLQRTQHGVEGGVTDTACIHSNHQRSRSEKWVCWICKPHRYLDSTSVPEALLSTRAPRHDKGKNRGFGIKVGATAGETLGEKSENSAASTTAGKRSLMGGVLQ
jgi:hypothetical protein